MKRQSINEPVLVLNKGWSAITITSTKKAIAKVGNDLAQILDPETYVLYNLMDWAALPVYEGQEFIQTAHAKVRQPEIIVLSDFDKMPVREVKLTRRNLLIRDNYTCQYTGRKITNETGTIDHVKPRAQGGKSTWDNLVMCCLEVNAKKADRTPEQAGLKLLTVPIKPKWTPLYSRFARLATASNIRPSWKKFLKFENTGEVVGVNK